MAENDELLDLEKTPRWQRVLHAIKQGEPIEQVTDKAVASLYLTVRALKKLIPIERLLSASCNDPDSLIDLIRQCGKGRDFARLFQANKGQGRERVLQDYFWTICDKYLDQVAIHSFPSERWSSLADLHQHLSRVRESLGCHVDRIAHELAQNPDWQPRMRPSRNGSRSKNATQALLNESLLGVSSK